MGIGIEDIIISLIVIKTIFTLEISLGFYRKSKINIGGNGLSNFAIAISNGNCSIWIAIKYASREYSIRFIISCLLKTVCFLTCFHFNGFNSNKNLLFEHCETRWKINLMFCIVYCTKVK